MTLLKLLNIKNKGIEYVCINCVLIIVFSIFYWFADLIQIQDMTDPWYYWLYFSGITQTTIGYSGIEYKGTPGVNIMTIKSTILKTCIFLQIFSVIIMNGYFLLM
tara:strand:+ start:379 stop:693 length:315 start_codon:yes stop_codon:yes gene_type:complete